MTKEKKFISDIDKFLSKKSNDPAYYTTESLNEYLKISKTTISNWRKKGEETVEFRMVDYYTHAQERIMDKLQRLFISGTLPRDQVYAIDKYIFHQTTASQHRDKITSLPRINLILVDHGADGKP